MHIEDLAELSKKKSSIINLLTTHVPILNILAGTPDLMFFFLEGSDFPFSI
jgi:hypothetical protein